MLLAPWTTVTLALVLSSSCRQICPTLTWRTRTFLPNWPRSSSCPFCNHQQQEEFILPSCRRAPESSVLETVHLDSAMKLTRQVSHCYANVSNEASIHWFAARSRPAHAPVTWRMRRAMQPCYAIATLPAMWDSCCEHGYGQKECLESGFMNNVPSLQFALLCYVGMLAHKKWRKVVTSLLDIPGPDMCATYAAGHLLRNFCPGPPDPSGDHERPFTRARGALAPAFLLCGQV